MRKFRGGMKVKCKYCGAVKYVPPGRIKSPETYYCGAKKCRIRHMKSLKKCDKKRDFSHLKKLNNWAKILGHPDLFMDKI